MVCELQFLWFSFIQFGTFIRREAETNFEVMIGLVFVLIPIVLYLLYKWASLNHDYFEKQGIAFEKPFLLIGSEFFFFYKKHTLGLSMIENYNKYRNER